MLRTLLLLVVFAQTLHAAELPWVPLFNGKDFTGWKLIGPAGPASAVVADGAMRLHMQRNTTEHTFVTTEANYEDFILEMDFRDDGDFHSGVLLRCLAGAPEARIRLFGYQVKVDPTPRAWTGGIFDDFGSFIHWMYDLSENPRGRAAFKLGEWAHLRIEAIGPVLKVWVNGVPTCHLVDSRYAKGPIALKIHSLGNEPAKESIGAYYKSIRIITDDPARFARPMDLPPRTSPPWTAAEIEKRDQAYTASADAPLMPVLPESRFEKQVRLYEEIDRASPPPTGAILLAGDSQFFRWKTLHEDLPGYTLVNRGIDSFQTSDLLRFADRLILPHRPRMIILHVGGNDVNNRKSPARLLADFQAFVSLVRASLPGVPIAFSSITPGPGRWEQAAQRKEANRLVKDYIATQPGLHFIDLWDAMLTSDGQPREELWVEDRVHPNHAGYKLRVEIMRPLLGAPDQPAR